MTNTVPTVKPIEQQFRDWENDAFGYGYGTGEAHVLPALKKFLSLCNGLNLCTYDYKVLEKELGETVAWLLINILAKEDIISYGTSARYGFLTETGVRLKEFVSGKTEQELYDIATDGFNDYTYCYKDACNCGPNGHDPNRQCPNPFWTRHI